MDLSALSDADFAALQKGDLAAMSDAGFAMLAKAQVRAEPMAAKQARTRENMAKEYSPTAGMSTLDLLSAGAGKAVSNTGMAIQQALGSSVTRDTVDEMKARDAPLMKTGAGKAGFVMGSGAVGAPAMLAPGANTLLGSTMYGSLMGALSPVGEGDSVLQNGLFGAGGGAAGYGVGTGLAKVLGPKVSPETRAMVDSGITLTPGQQLGGGMKRFEDALTSLPFSGDLIKSQQRRAVEEFNASVANAALSPIGGKLPAGVTGRDAVRYVENAIGDVYDASLAKIGAVKGDAALTAELANLTKMVKTSPMPGQVKDQFLKTIKNQITGKLQGQQQAMTAQTFKDAESELGRLASLYGADASADKQLLGDALQEAQAAMRRWLERAAGPEAAADVKAANAGWAEFKRMQRAASMLGAKDGVFSPENYLNAVKALDRSKDKGGFARGNALGQPRAEAAVKTMGATVPDSGTPFRTLATEPVKGLTTMALTGPLVAPIYNRPVLSALQTVMSGKRPALATKAAARLQDEAALLRILGLSGASAAQVER